MREILRLQNEKSPPFFIKRKFNNKRGKGFKILKGFSCFFTRFLFFLLKIPHTPSKIVHFIQALGNTFQYWTHHAHVLIGGVDHQESSEIIMLSLCSRTSQWNFNDNFVSSTTVQFLILFNFHITILDTFNEENLTLDKPVIYCDEETGQTGRNRFTQGIKWVRKGPGANCVGFIGRLWKVLFLTNRKSWRFCSQWQDILTSPWHFETVFKSPNASIHNIKRRYVPLT